MKIQRFSTFKLTTIVFLFLGFQNLYFGQTISTFPAALGGDVTICQGQSIIYNVNSPASGTGYSWTFGAGASPQTANGSGQHVITYNSITNGTPAVLLANGTAVGSINVIVNPIPASTITLLNSGLGWNTITSNGLTLFRNCLSSALTTFNFGVTAYAVGTTQTFNWGDGTPSATQADLVGNQISHGYGLGQYTLTHTVVLPNGCQVIKQYTVFNGQAPNITVSGSGQNTCLPFPYDLDILSNNVPGTLYNVSFSDGSPESVFTTVNDTTISHVFNSSSCDSS
jgi:hypothetical protein